MDVVEEETSSTRGKGALEVGSDEGGAGEEGFPRFGDAPKSGYGFCRHP